MLMNKNGFHGENLEELTWKLGTAHSCPKTKKKREINNHVFDFQLLFFCMG